MKYQLRDYQQQASDAAVSFFLDRTRQHNALIVAATGCHSKGRQLTNVRF